jgi:hypothetical protein
VSSCCWKLPLRSSDIHTGIAVCLSTLS